MTVLRPFFKHYGGKWLLSGRCPPPVHDTIIEPFAGAAGYSTRYGAGRRVLLYDTDAGTCAIWRWLLAASPADVLALPVQPFHDGADVREVDMEPAARLFVQRWLTTQGSRTNYRMTPMVRDWIGKSPGSMWTERVRQRIADQLPAIREWTIHEEPYTAAPDIIGTWHIDPPYQGNDSAQTAYGTSTMPDFTLLGAWCMGLRGQVMVHEQHGADWLPFVTLNASGRTGSTVGSKMKAAHEVWAAWSTI